jgi:hypothetical protein
MSDQRLPEGRTPRGPFTLWLERLTAAALVGVLLSVVWMVAVASAPLEWLRLPSIEAEVVVVIALLTLAVLLVSVVALIHTRK